MSTVYTVGHSTHSCDEFTRLLTCHRIEVVVDTRSAPYSRYTPQFDREILLKSMLKSGIKYLFFGAELGGRPQNPAYYDTTGRVLYGKITTDSTFLGAIQRLERGMANYHVALMCGEEDPAHCHRRLLIARVLIERGHEVLHIRGDASLHTEAEIAAASGKPLVNEQPALFAELDEDQWRSTASVSPKRTPANSSAS